MLALSDLPESFMRHLYSAALYLSLPLLLTWLLLRSLSQRAYRRRWRERLGLFPPPAPAGEPVIWVHAVSVGEVEAAAPLIDAWLAAGRPLVVTTTTPTGSARVRARFGGRVFHVYLPWDLPGAVRRTLVRLRPGVLVLVETELWPNLLHQARAAGVPVALVNARLSARSAARYALIPGITLPMLRAIDRIACQDEADRDRFAALGAAPERLVVTGSLKFELSAPPPARVVALARELGLDKQPLLVAGSTHRGEEAMVLDAFAVLSAAGRECRLAIAPRHPERAGEIAALCAARGLNVWRRSLGAGQAAAEDVILLDTIGELATLYACAAVVFVGGSLVSRGGQNTLEAAVCGVPVLCGPHTENFAAVNASLASAGALAEVDGPARLGELLGELLDDAPRRRAMGEAARTVVAANRGAGQRQRGLVEALLAGTAFQRRISGASGSPGSVPDAVGGGGGSR
jgi:3-deoxy-D-manno-octulosonic-acid transferase